MTQPNAVYSTGHFITEDNYQIPYTRFDPPSSNGSVMVVLPALAVWARYYRDFALHFAEKGYTVYTFDYRGVGEAKPKSLKGLDADLVTWAKQDTAGLVRFIKKEHLDSPIYAISHSLGGQVLGFYPEAIHIRKHIFVGSSSPGFSSYPKYGWPMLFVLWYGILPGISNLFGYFPGKKMGMFGDLPKGVAKQWAKWCRTKGYGLSHPEATYFEKITAPILTYSFDDDTTAPRKTIEALIPAYPNANIEHRHIHPKEVAMDSIGHFGFFKQKSRDGLWGQVEEWFAPDPQTP